MLLDAHPASAPRANSFVVPSPVTFVTPPAHPATANVQAVPASCGLYASGGLQQRPSSPQHQLEPPNIHEGTHHTNLSSNINKIYENDILTLARAVTEVARSSATEAKKHAQVSLSLPIFEGKPTDWLIFKKVYDATSPSFSPSDNLVRISTALRGLARDSVSVLIAASRDPTEVMLALETTFARPEHIILSEIALVRGLPKLSGSESVHELCTFACRVRNCTAVIKLLGRSEYLASPELSNEIVAKMTPLLRARWADYASSRETDGHRLLLLSDFLSREADQRSKYEVFIDSTKRSLKGGPTKDFCFNATVVPSSGSLVCLFCVASGHHVKQCRQFTSLTSSDRWLWVNKVKVCHKCLSKGGHRYLSCKKDNCKVKGCDKKWTHNTLLHRDETASPNKPSVRQFTGQTTLSTQSDQRLVSELEAPSSAVQTVVASHNLSSSRELNYRPLLKVVPVTVRGPKGDIDTFALLDDGSTATLVDASLADALGITGVTSSMRVEAITGMAKDCDVKLLDLDIKGRFCDTWYTLKQVRSIRDLGLSYQTVGAADVVYPHLKDITENLCYDDAKPSILIGIDHWHLSIAQQVRRGSLSQPVAALTALGWVIFGSLKGKTNESLNCVVVNKLSVEPLDEINTQLKDYFKIDSIGISNRIYFSDNDKLAIRTLEETTKRLPDGRFETGLPWRPNITVVPNTYELARSRFLSLERKMSRDPKYAEAYRRNINASIDKGYAELCQSKPVPGAITWYLPHFGVVQPQKNKLRVVHDAAATCRGISLNSMLLAGPDLLQPLLAIIMRFREGLIALSGDIREMFPQTKIRQEDRDAQRFLWRDDPSKPLAEYRMASMMFGAVSSPFTAQYLKNRNAEEHRHLFPDAADAIVYNHYMDDYLGSVDTVEKARTLAANIVDIHAKACLEMRSWLSNEPSALSLVPESLRATNASLVDVRVLGVTWDIKTDALRFSRKTFENPPSKLTKRSVLAYLMKVYDPLGLLTPLIIRGRIIFQQTWKLSLDWDQVLPPQMETQWNAWFTACDELLIGSISRHYLNHKTANLHPQLHIFADASELAYACVAYWRFECTDGSIHLSLIGGKARVAPLKPVSIPRLELQAALAAARFYQYIIDAHSLQPTKTVFWTDSQTVLKWLRSEARTFKPFVANRVGEIAEVTRVADWRYVPTALNIADDATRINKRFDLSARWFSGPQFLHLNYSEWPTEPVHGPPETTNELKQPFIQIVNQTTHHPIIPSPVVPDTTRFSSWIRLLRSTARVIVVARIFKAKLSVHDLNADLSRTTSRDIQIAEQHILLQSQLTSMKEDYTRVLRRQVLQNDSRIKSLSVFIDPKTQLLRLAGRIGALENSSVSNNPVVLCGKDRTVRLLIAFYHEKAAHGNNELVVNELLRTYYIIGVRPAVKKVAISCLRCRIRKAKPTPPLMGNLPPERLAHHVRPFTFVGLDYFGPVFVTVGRHKEKRYVALFTCLTVRAVHLEIVTSLTLDSAIMALRRFIARRGVPAKVFSDNGTAFVGANRVLSEQPLLDFAANMKIEWQFIPPAAPFMGGCWERLVRSVKTALSVTLHSRAPSDETFGTFLLEVESLINSRPLTHVVVAPGEDQAITPFHFILGSSSPHSIIGQLDDADLVRRVTWKKGLRMADHFWARWVKEYLPTLVPKLSSTSSRNVEVGDQVVLADGNLPRGVWPRGRIAKTYPGRDGVVRVVDIVTPAGTLRRPVRKLAMLPK